MNINPDTCDLPKLSLIDKKKIEQRRGRGDEVTKSTRAAPVIIRKTPLRARCKPLTNFGKKERKKKNLAIALKLVGRVVAQIANTRSRSYYTSRTKRLSLYSKISPLGNPNTSIAPELDDWVYNSNMVRVGEIQRIVHDLRKRRRFAQALEIRSRCS
ncbi:hypothetical protein PIB30_028515 [Stylosanthes scabra]|uniref:Uncharacterized protein n=1 Tax=Stylosanthes scabra TaxID=79078 RepID=A0ABU6RB82_9FABA|nr:hypothetical protein [Stylosanthes scabra]